MHSTLSPALVRPRAARGPVAIMISQKPLKAGAEIEWSNLVPFVGLELKTARTATVPSSSICPTTSVAVGYHMAFVYVAPRSHTPGRCAPPGAKLEPALVPCYFLLFRGVIRSAFGTRTDPPTNCISSVPPPPAGAGGGSSRRGAF